MATVQSRRLRRRAYHEDSYDAPRRSRRRWAPWGLLGGLILLAWFAPTIVAHTSMRDRILARLADVEGRITSSGARFGWMSSIAVEGIEIHDKRGDRVAQVPELLGDKTLLQLLLNRAELGHFRVVQPDVRVVLREEGTNIEELLKRWLEDDSTESTKAIDVDVVGAKLTVVDERTKAEWTITSCDAAVRVPSGADGIVECTAKGTAAEGTNSGQFDVACDIPAATPGKPRLAKGTFKTTNFPLALAGGAIRRFSPGTELAGRLTSQLSGHWNLDGKSRRDALVEGLIKTAELRAAGPWLGEDQLKLAQAEIPCRLVWQGDLLKLEKLNVACDLGTADVSGSVDTSQNWMASLWNQPYEVKGQLRLAELARTLPHTIRLRDNTRITDGLVNVSLISQSTARGLQWDGRVDTTQLVAVRDGKQFGWDQPIHLSFAAHDSADGVVIDRLYGEADFLELEGSGTPRQGQISGSYNLDRLSDELGKFVDFGDLELAGTGWVHSTWKQDGNGRWDADAELEVNDFALARPGRPAWHESKLLVALTAAGDIAERKLQRVDAGQMLVTAGNDKLKIRLLGPVAEFGDAGLWPIELTLNGAVDKWQPRLDPWFDFPAGWNLAGDCDLVATATWSPKSMSVENLTGTIRKFRSWGHGWFIDEPEAQLSGAAYWNGERRRLEISEVELKSSAVWVHADDVVWSWSDDGSVDIRGLARYRGDLERLARWTHDPAQPADHQVSGTFDGEAVLSRTGSTTEARWQSTARDVSVGFSGKEPWKEAQIWLAGRGRHDRQSDKIELTSFELGSAGLNITAAGEITDVDKRRNVDLDGRVRYDLAKLEPLWDRLVGGDLKIAGVETRAFSLRGPLSPPEIPKTREGTLGQVVTFERQRAHVPGDPSVKHYSDRAAPPPAARDVWLRELTGKASVGWDSIQLYGLGLGRGVADAALADGLVRVAPLSVTASGGRLNLAPALRLAPGPMQLSLAPGQLADHLQITPQMCEEALKYIAPILAGVTQAQGAFSVNLDGCQIPLTEPKKGDVAGKLTVHSVEIGPGPLVQELAILLNRAAPARLTRESVVDFRLVDGRVYHRGLELVFPDATIRTYGSVGLDQTVSMVAELPVPPKWIGNNRLGSAIRNQTIRLPIGGTLYQPRLDQTALQQTSAQFIRNAAGAAIEGEIQRQIDRQLQRLFGPGQ